MRTFLPAFLLLAAAAWAEPPALTIYNQDFAVVRETVPLELRAGVSTVSFSGLTAQLEPDSVVLRDPAEKVPFRILEQSYRNDPISEGLLLKLNEGKTIRFLVEEQEGPDRTVPGKIIRSGYEGAEGAGQPVIEVEGELRFSLPGKPLFPSLGDGAILQPTLTWSIASEAAAKLQAELGYVTRGLTWAASYNLVAPEQGNELDLTGWVTINNTSGKTFPEADLKLLAGDVQKLEPPVPAAPGRATLAMKAPMDDEAVQEKKLDDFHLYTLPRRTTLRDKETKQVEFLRALGLRAQRSYEFDGAAPRYRTYRGGTYIEPPDESERGNTKVTIRVEFQNNAENHLNVPLPAGRMRLYRRDGAQLQFVGEDQIDHTPRGETIRLVTGQAFDLVGERRLTSFKAENSQHWIEEAFSIEVRNGGDQPAEVQVLERLYRAANWNILEKSLPYTQKDSRTVYFTLPVPAHGKNAVTYKVRYTW